ncbi:MAG: tRNA (5-methylaminomethyl-2-thiouridylate)-methyltransferase [Gammaproteobacteria bacterium]|nr:tRNA (5-methylaminomethyl-2-thiouridylate)-methyltransferase [Gammaproteobacteria bacterium]
MSLPASLSASAAANAAKPRVAGARKAVALISGGLDSMLAAKVILDLGIHVEGINFYTGFCVEGHTQAIRSHERDKPKRNNALWTAEQLGIKLHIIEVIEEYKEIVINPKHGYGHNLNPCLDCKGFMVRKAREWMEKNGFDFIITGEVIGQRPMSQRRDTMPVVARESGAFDRLLRPLCAKLLPPTMPEREGWVDREKLLDFNGRGRKPQMQLAEQYGFKEYAQPAGGCCFLTNEQYSHKLADLWQTRGTKQYELDDIMLLKVGRHLRPRPHFKLIVGRDEGENNFLNGYRRRFIHLTATSHPGPMVLLEGTANDDDLLLAARLTARFGRGREDALVNVSITDREGQTRALEVTPILANEIPAEWYL